MRLDEAIVNNLDAAERAALAAGLGVVDWAALPGEPAAARAAALVDHAGRAGKTAALFDALAAARPGVPWAELPYPRATLHRLHAALCRRHTLDSLRTLCFRLGVDFDDLPGETKAGRARELVLAMERMGRVAELLESDEFRDTRVEIRNTRLRRRSVERFAKSPPRVRRSVERFAKSPPRVLNSHLVSHISYFALIWLIAGGLVWVAARQDLTGFQRVPPANLSGLPATDEHQNPAGRSATDHSEIQTTRVEIAVATLSPTATRQDLTGFQRVPPANLSGLPTPMVIVGERGANLRRGPGPDFAVVATLRAGARLELRAVSPTGEWYQVRLPGRGSPWIDAGYATVIGGVGGLPVMTLPATASVVSAPPSLTPQAVTAASPTPRATRPPPTPAPSPLPTRTAAVLAPTLPPP